MKISEYKNNDLVSSEELKEMNKPDLGAKNSADFSKYTFWQYTSVDTIERILDGNCFWVNSISGMNDLHESELHKDEKEDIFIQCFCNSNNEKIPMWYLYGGIAGKGACIGFTPRVMMDYINSIKYVTELVYDSNIDSYVIGKQLEKDIDFELQVGWVFYTDYELPLNTDETKKKIVRVNYFNKFLNVKEAGSFFDGNYFIKDYPWEYEKEFRLVFINKTGRKLDKIKIDIPQEFREKKNLKIKLAPEISNNTDVTSGMSEYESCAGNLQKIAEKNNYRISVSKSDLRIKMDLLGRGKSDVNDYVFRNPDYLNKETQKKVSEHFANL